MSPSTQWMTEASTHFQASHPNDEREALHKETLHKEKMIEAPMQEMTLELQRVKRRVTTSRG